MALQWARKAGSHGIGKRCTLHNGGPHFFGQIKCNACAPEPYNHAGDPAPAVMLSETAFQIINNRPIEHTVFGLNCAPIEPEHDAIDAGVIQDCGTDLTTVDGVPCVNAAY